MTMNEINASVLRGYMMDHKLTVTDVAVKSGFPEEEIRRVMFVGHKKRLYVRSERFRP